MNAADLIKARMEGVTFDRIYESVRHRRDTFCSLNEDHLELFESMLSEIKKGVTELEVAINRDNLDSVKATSRSLQELLQMVGDSCEG